MGSRLLSVSVHPSGATRAAGLKRQLFRQPLAGVTLLVGPNGAGKTTRGPLAITAALEGLAQVPTDPRRPYVGPLPEDTAVSLDVQTPDGVQVLTRDLSVARGRAVDAANQRARDLVGIPPTAWDLRDFATATDGGRASILDAVARAGGRLQQWDAAQAQDHVRGLHDAARPANIEADVWAMPREEMIAELASSVDGATWLRAAEDVAATLQTTTNARQREAGGHMSEVAQSAPPRPSRDREADEEAHRALLREQTAYEAARANAADARAAHARHLAEGQRLRDHLAATEAEGRRLAEVTPAPSTDVPADVAKRLSDAEQAVDQPVPPFQRDQNLPVELESAEAALAALPSVDRAALHAAVAEASEARAAALAEVAALESVSGQGHATCRHCEGPDPLGVVAELDQARARLAPLTEALAAARQAAADADAVHEQATALTATIGRLRERQADEEEAAGHHARQVHAARIRALDDARADLTRAKQQIHERMAAHAAAEERRVLDLEQARARWAAARAALREWEALPVPPLPGEAEPGDLAQRLDESAARMREWTVIDQHDATARAAAARYQAARYRWDSARALLAAVRQARDDLASAAYRPIHEAAAALLADAPGLPAPYFRAPDDYGATIPGRGEVPYAGLSESEQRITAAALVYALATVAGCPCRLVLLDGIEVVERAHRLPLLQALAAAVEAGRVDNVVLTMAASPDEDAPELAAVPGLTVHQITRVTPARTPAPQPSAPDAPPF